MSILQPDAASSYRGHLPEKLLQCVNITIRYIYLRMLFILFIVIALVAWALHLMQEAVEQREFSLMLAGFLVSVAAAALVGVYFLMGHYVGYMSQASQAAYSNYEYYSLPIDDEWFAPVDYWVEGRSNTIETADLTATHTF